LALREQRESSVKPLSSLGPAAAEALFDAGLRRATVTQIRAQYDETVATYRQVVLTSFLRMSTQLSTRIILAAQLPS
jgi:outer membrane protein TolC